MSQCSVSQCVQLNQCSVSQCSGESVFSESVFTVQVSQCSVSQCPLVTLSGPRCDRCSPGFYGNLALPGASCEECPCNNNIELGDRNACDGLTGECLRCLHNTFGPRCQDCKPGYYGNALDQDCKGKDRWWSGCFFTARLKMCFHQRYSTP